MRKMRVLFCLLTLSAAPWFGGCGPARETAETTSAGSVVIPAASSYGVAYGANNVGQTASLITGASPESFSEEISLKEVQRLARGHDASGLWVEAKWKYMGTRDGYHFLAYYPLIGLRKIYRLPETQLSLEDTHPVRTFESQWRPLRSSELNPSALNEWPELNLQPGPALFPTNGYQLILRSQPAPLPTNGYQYFLRPMVIPPLATNSP
jgi:hypothetical protein